MKLRGFEKISKYQDNDFKMPVRKTKFSAGYDFFCPEDVVLKAGKLTVVPTGIKAYMQDNEWLGIHIRSSYAIKKNLTLVNDVGVIDADYYNNPDNEGHIMVALRNNNDEDFVIKKNDAFAQGIFESFLITDNDDKDEKEERTGGIGSTDKK